MKKRVLSAIVMFIIVIPLLILGRLPFKIAITILNVLGIYELLKAKEKEKQLPLVLKIFAYICGMCLVYFTNDNYSVNTLIDIRFLGTLFLVFLIPIVIINDDSKYNINDSLYLISGVLFISFALNGFIIIRNISLAHMIYIMLITIMTDTFALFTGMLIGEHKLCEKISPKKTLEGAIGGSLVGSIVATLFYIFVVDQTANVFLILFITLLLTVVGQIGDLLFSSIKRHYKIKDFSNLIPGHGGILDRLDSLILVVLTYLLIYGIL